MNLNQAAHGDREYGFGGTRMRLARKVVMGYWKDEATLQEIGTWMRGCGLPHQPAAEGDALGDNMREVAVTEGDKVEAQMKFGWQVNTWPVGSLWKRWPA